MLFFVNIFMVFMVVMVHPLSMIFSLLFYSFVLSFYFYFKVSLFWYSYVLLFVMISGMLVVMSYMISLLPDQGFLYWLYGGIFSLVVFFVFFDNCFSLGGVDMYCLWEDDFGWWVLYMLSLLFFLMLVVVWLGLWEEGPIRL